MKQPVDIRRKPPVGKIVAISLAILLLIGGSVWAVRESMESRQEASNLADVQQMREQFKPEVMKEMTPEQRGELFKEYQEKSKKLTFGQRKKLSDERYVEEKKRYDEYFSASEADRPAVLARQMDEMRKRWGGGPGGGRGRRGGNANQNGNNNNAAGQGGNNPAGAQQANANPPTPEDLRSREQRRREYLDMTTPEQRAQRSVYRQAMREMRQQQAGGR